MRRVGRDGHSLNANRVLCLNQSRADRVRPGGTVDCITAESRTIRRASLLRLEMKNAMKDAIHKAGGWRVIDAVAHHHAVP